MISYRGYRQRQINARPGNKPLIGDLTHTKTLGASSAITTQPGTANNINLYMWLPAYTMRLDMVYINVAAFLAGANCKAVLYSADRNGNPHRLLYESGNLTCAANGPVFEPIATPITVVGSERYYAGIRFSGAQTISAWIYSSVPDLSGGAAPNIGTAPKALIRNNVAFGSPAPDPWGYNSAELAGANPAAIWFRVAA